MSDHGSSFATATVLSQPVDHLTGIIEFLGDEDFFTFTITNATNEVYIHVQYLPDDNNSSPSGAWDPDLHDGAFALVAPTDAYNLDAASIRHHKNLAADTYYVKLKRTINQAYRRYVIGVWTWENNIFNNIEDHGNANYLQDFRTGVAFDHSVIHNGNTFFLNATNPRRTKHWFDNTKVTEKYQVSGTVYQDGGTVAGRLLRLYDRTTGELIGETTSIAGGAYTFNTLLFSDAKYYVVAFDDGVPDLQAKVRDYLTPKTIAL